MDFHKINDININNIDSWKNKLFLTFDIDWCSDEVLTYTLNIIEKYNIKATFFVTHQTKLLERMRENKNIELGIHPNFNPLLNADFKYGKNINEVIEYYLNIVPKAISVRSHSMTQNSHILDAFDKYGLKYDCNTFIPFSSNTELRPFKHWSKTLIKVPYFWEDDVHCAYNWDWGIAKFLQHPSLKVFDFHPIHIFLNTEHLDRYENNRDFQKNSKILFENKFKGYGSENFFIDLIEKVKDTK